MNNVINWFKDGNRIERILLLAEIEFKLRYYGNKLGLLWALINPIALIAMYFVVFEFMLQQGIENYAVYLFAGFLVWIYFTDCTSRAVNTLKSKRQYYENTDMSKLEIFIALHASTSIGFVFNFFIFLIWSSLSGIYPSLYFIFIPVLFINLVILSMGISMILSSLFILFQDITQIWSIVLRFGFFLSPILYRGELFEEKLAFLNYLNPIAGIIVNTRNILLYSKYPNLELLLFDYAYALVILIIGFSMLKKIGPKASEVI